VFVVRIIFQTQWPDGRQLQLRQSIYWSRRNTEL